VCSAAFKVAAIAFAMFGAAEVGCFAPPQASKSVDVDVNLNMNATVDLVVDAFIGGFPAMLTNKLACDRVRTTFLATDVDDNVDV
jgi:hypothetical protein